MQFEQDLDKRYILVVGDVMIDSYMWGNVTRISPEAPVPIVAVTRRENRLGGAANVALNIKAMEANAVICTVLGNDDHNKDFLQIMFEKGLDTRGVITSDTRRTTVKSRVIGNRMHIVRVDDEDTFPLCVADEDGLIERIRRVLKMLPVSAIIFQDYDKGVITSRVIDEVTTMAKKKKIVTTVDPKHRNFSAFHDVTLFKPNLKELREGLNIEIDTRSAESMQRDLDKAALLLHDRQHIDIVMVTLSELGVYACDFRGEKPESFVLPAQRREISDVSGAGDTVISVATLALAQGLPLKEVVHYANMAGGIVCEQVGVVPIDKGRLLSEINACSV